MKHLFALLLLPVCALAYNPGPPTNNSATPGPPGQAYVISITGTSAANGTITFAGSGVSQGGANGRTFTFQAGAASNGLNSVVNTTNPAGVASLSGNILYIGTNALSLDTNTVLALINASTNVGARLASNVWAAAGSTTNYALRRDGRATPIYGIGNVYSDGGHAAVNDMNTRLDLRSTNKSFAVLGLYQTATNLNTDWPPALDLWNYGSTVTGVIPENIRSGKLLLGVHTAEGTWGPQMYGIWGGASNDGFGMVTAFADSFGLPQERTRVTWQGFSVSGTVTAAGFASSNVVARTGDTMSGNLVLSNGYVIVTRSLAQFVGQDGTTSNSIAVNASDNFAAAIIPRHRGVTGKSFSYVALTNGGFTTSVTDVGGISNFPSWTFSGANVGAISNLWVLNHASASTFSGNGAGLTGLNGASITNLSAFSTVATNGSGNVITNLVSGGSVITQQMGTVSGGGGGGDVYLSSNNQFEAGTTQRFDIAIGSNLTLRSSGNQFRIQDVGGTARFSVNLTNSSSEAGLQYIFDSPDEQHVVWRRAGIHGFMFSSGISAADFTFGSDMEGNAGNIWNRSSSSPNYANVGMNLAQRRSDSTHVSWTFVAFSNSFATGHKMMDMTFYRIPNSAQSHGSVTVNSSAGASTGHLNTHFNVLGTGGVYWAFYVDSTSNTTRRARSPRTVISTNTMNVRYTNTFGRAIRLSVQVSMTNTATEMSAFELHTTGNTLLDRAEHRAAATPDEKQDVIHSPLPINVEDWWIITNKSVGAATGSVVTTIFVND